MYYLGRYVHGSFLPKQPNRPIPAKQSITLKCLINLKPLEKQSFQQLMQKWDQTKHHLHNRTHNKRNTNQRK